MVKKSSVEDVLPLSPMQQGMFFHALFDDDAPDVYTGQLMLELDGPLDPGRLRAAAQALLERHANLRAGFRTLRSGTAVQVVRPRVSLPWREVELSDAADREAELDRLATADRAAGFDLARPPLVRCVLVRVGEREHRLLLTSHHLLWDGWSAAILVRELFELYGADADPTALPRVAPYRDYLAWLSRQDDRAAGEAWRVALADVDGPTLVAPSMTRESAGRPLQVTRELPESVTSRLADVARAHGLTVNTVVQGLWSLLVGTLTGRTDVVFGATVSGRSADLPDIESMVGLFINTVPVRSRLRGGEALTEFLRRLQGEQAELLDHQHVGLTEIQRACDHGTLFDTLVVLETYPIDEQGIAASLGAEGLRLSGVTAHDATHYPLTLIATPGRRTELRLGYQPAAFDTDTVENVADRLVHLVHTFVDEPQRAVGQLGPGRTAGRRGPDTTIAFDSVRDLLRDRVRRTPDALALVDGEQTVTYAELDARADRLARALLARGAGPETTVAVALPRSADLVVALLAVLKTGAVYVPVDITYPRERIDLMIADSGARLVVCEPGFARSTGLEAARTFRIDEIPAEPDDLELPRIVADHSAYVVFTSGSTGRPKAVVGTQRALVNRLLWGRTALAGPQPAIRLAKSPVSFIDGTTELLTGLVAGDTVVLADDAEAADPLAMAELVDRHRASALTVVPSLLAALVAAAPPGALESVTTWISSGEPLPAGLVRAVGERWPRARLVNLYGCSEAAGDSLAHALVAAADPVPIGEPIANTQVVILDRFLRPVPDGVVGELYLAGSGLARGYLGRPARTAERFVANPFGPPGSRLYRTGDLARTRRDGLVEFAGRADDQAKIRGFRVEPAEVESVLGDMAGVRQAAAVVRPDGSGENRLVAHVIPEPGAEVEPLELRRRLAETLPAHLVPAAIVVSGSLPHTPSGKLDRRALPAPDFGTLATDEGPRSGTETLLCGMFADVLGLEQVGIHDHFFELGGNSITSVQLVGRARAAGLTLSPRDVFTCQTVAELAGVVAEQADDHRDATAAVPEDRPLVSLTSSQLDKVLDRWRT